MIMNDGWFENAILIGVEVIIIVGILGVAIPHLLSSNSDIGVISGCILALLTIIWIIGRFSGQISVKEFLDKD